MMLGETLAEGGSVDPALAMWMPNAAAGLVGLPLLLWLYRR
jgi:lipopolysaccharide export LptBFGC system permease protein LptF